MTFNIIDKNPRRARKEGPKAQQAYVEGLYDEWISGHALETAPPVPHSGFNNDTGVWEDARGRTVPAHLVERAEKLEAETLAKLNGEVIEVRTAEVDIACYAETCHLKMLGDLRLLGRVREHLVDQAEAIGIAVPWIRKGIPTTDPKPQTAGAD